MINLPEKIKVGDIVNLSDEDSLKLSMSEGKGVTPKEYIIQKITKVKDSRGLASWELLHLNENDIIMIKKVDHNFDVYFHTYTGLPTGNRKQQIDAGFNWLFQAPENENDYHIIDLKYSTDVIETKSTGESVKYDIKPQGELSGFATIDPALSGVGELVGTIVEYANADGRQALITEIGELNNLDGGLITLYSGKQIPAKDVDFIQK